MCLSLSDLSQSARSCAGPPVLSHMATFHPFSWPSNIPWCPWTTSSLFVPLLMDFKTKALTRHNEVPGDRFPGIYLKKPKTQAPPPRSRQHCWQKPRFLKQPLLGSALLPHKDAFTRAGGRTWRTQEEEHCHASCGHPDKWTANTGEPSPGQPGPAQAPYTS